MRVALLGLLCVGCSLFRADVKGPDCDPDDPTPYVEGATAALTALVGGAVTVVIAGDPTFGEERKLMVSALGIAVTTGVLVAAAGRGFRLNARCRAARAPE